LKGTDRMRPEERAALRLLAAWRETRALARNLPRGWVLSDDALRELARRRPASAHELQQVPGIPGAVAGRHRAELLELIAGAAGQLSDSDLAPAVDRLAPEQAAAVRRLQDELQKVAVDAGLAPEILATRKDLTALVRGARDVPPVSGWRRDVVGERLLSLI
jgi:ribonuclease D